jgi:hypothetical protein
MTLKLNIIFFLWNISYFKNQFKVLAIALKYLKVLNINQLIKD